MNGYLSRSYAQSLSEWGSPVSLPKSGGWVLRRPVFDTGYRDAMGVYPLLCCSDWEELESDVNTLRDIVSLVFVPDPFADMKDTFWLDLYAPYKPHHILDYAKHYTFTKHHRYYARKAKCVVEMTTSPDLSTWHGLYSNLIERHGITGIQAFSLNSFERQLKVPGLVAFQAYDDTGVIAMHLWYTQNNVAYSHLAACSQRGYETFAAYALVDVAIKSFYGIVRYLDLGATADEGSDGLDFFKRGWANDIRQAYLCGKILDLKAYKELTDASVPSKAYFPAYRSHEH